MNQNLTEQRGNLFLAAVSGEIMGGIIFLVLQIIQHGGFEKALNSLTTNQMLGLMALSLLIPSTAILSRVPNPRTKNI